MPDNHDYRLFLESEFKGLHSLMNAQFETVHDRLTGIDDHLKTLNGSVAKHEEKISSNLPHSIVHCAQKDVIDKIEDELIGSKAVERKLKEKREEHGAVVGRWILILGIAVSIILGVYNILSNRPLPKDVATIKNELKSLGVPVVTRNGKFVALPDSSQIMFFPNDSVRYLIIRDSNYE